MYRGCSANPISRSTTGTSTAYRLLNVGLCAGQRRQTDEMPHGTYYLGRYCSLSVFEHSRGVGGGGKCVTVQINAFQPGVYISLPFFAKTAGDRNVCFAREGGGGADSPPAVRASHTLWFHSHNFPKARDFDYRDRTSNVKCLRIPTEMPAKTTS